MAEEKFTPGPWKADERGVYIWAKDASGAFMIAQTRGWGHLTGAGGLNLPSEEAIAIQTANARLCASAPALLRELQNLARHMEAFDAAGMLGTNGRQSLNGARQAIREATTGEQGE